MCFCCFVFYVGSKLKLHRSKRVLKHLFSSICPPRDQATVLWTHTRNVEREWPGWGMMGMATGFRVPCNPKAGEHKLPTQRRFPQLWQSLPLARASSAYCAHDGTPPTFSSEQTKLAWQPRRAGSHDDIIRPSAIIRCSLSRVMSRSSHCKMLRNGIRV